VWLARMSTLTCANESGGQSSQLPLVAESLGMGIKTFMNLVHASTLFLPCV
jgi:hypothetical protein